MTDVVKAACPNCGFDAAAPVTQPIAVTVLAVETLPASDECGYCHQNRKAHPIKGHEFIELPRRVRIEWQRGEESNVTETTEDELTELDAATFVAKALA